MMDDVYDVNASSDFEPVVKTVRFPPSFGVFTS